MALNEEDGKQQLTEGGRDGVDKLQGLLKDQLQVKENAADSTKLSINPGDRVSKIDENADIVIQRPESEAQSPLVSAKSWHDLNLSKELLLGVESLGFRNPSKIQAAALPLILNHQGNLIAQAQNGSGKTATFALAMLSSANPDKQQPQSLCLVPTRELALQTVKVLALLSRFTKISIFTAIPQAKTENDTAELKSDELNSRIFNVNTSYLVTQQVVVGTPGKCMELLKKRKFGVHSLVMLVLDEADELINFRNNMAPQVHQIRSFFPQKLQILLFSATFSEEVQSFAAKLIPNATKMTLKKEELTLTCIQQYFMLCDANEEVQLDDKDISTLDEEAAAHMQKYKDQQGGFRNVSKRQLIGIFQRKYQTLKLLYESLTVGQSVIFVNSRRLAFYLALKLQQELNFSVSLICGSQAQGPEKLSIEIRDKIMEEYRRGETKVLICTDVLSRGIDVPQVTLVINFDIPLRHYSSRVSNIQSPFLQNVSRSNDEESYTVNMETYLHRIGRTGRFGLKGIAVNLVSSEELYIIDEIKKFYKCDIEPLEADQEAIEYMIKNLRAQG